MRFPEINSFQKHLEFLSRELLNRFFRIRPRKLVFLEPFLRKTKSVSVPPYRFQNLSLLITEKKNTSRKRIFLHTVLYQRRKSVNRVTHIGISWPDKNATCCQIDQHDSLQMISTSALISLIAVFAGTCTFIAPTEMVYSAVDFISPYNFRGT